MQLDNRISTCWININRKCNLRCAWCYAQSTKYNQADMNISDAKHVVDIFASYGVRHFILLGGEPTLYPELANLLSYIHLKKSSSTIVTNAIRLSDMDYLNYLKNHHLNNVGLSIKAPNAQLFNSYTNSNDFNLIEQAIKNLYNLNIKFSTSIVLNEHSLDNIEEWINYCNNLGIKHINFTFCKTPFNSQYEIIEPKILIKKFSEKYEIINSLTNGHFSLHQTFPFCLWDEKLISLMQKRNQLRSLCQLHYHNGLIVDTNLNLCACNMLYDYPIGKIDNSIATGKDLHKFWDSEKTKQIYKSLLKLPDLECIQCKQLSFCAGGCTMQYFNYSLKDIKEK